MTQRSADNGGALRIPCAWGEEIMVTKILRMVRHRWWIILLAAVVGGVSGIALARARNSSIQPEFLATGVASLELPAQGGATSGRNVTTNTDTSDAEEGFELARTVNMEILLSEEGTLEFDERNAVLTFTATTRSEEAAQAVVEGMQNRWLEATREQILADRAERLDELLIQANDVLARIEVLTPDEVVEEPIEVPDDVQNRFENLDAILGALEPQLTRLEIDRVLSELGDETVDSVEEIDEQIVAFSARIDEVRTELQALADEWGLVSTRLTDGQPTQPVQPTDQNTAPNQPDVLEDATPEELQTQWQLEALTTQYGSLNQEYEDLYALDQAVTLPEPDEILVENLTPRRGPLPVFAFLGAVLFSLLALGGIFAAARIQRRIYTAGDLAPVPVLAEIPALVHHRNERVSIPEERLEGVKATRNSLITLIKSSDTTPAIGLSRVNIEPRHVRELAIELGRRLAASDLRVLVLDLDLDAASTAGDPSQYHSMTEFWAEIRRDPEAGADLLQRILADRFESAPSTMCVIMAGAVQGESDDLVLTRSFATFLDVCRREADIILAVAPDSEASATQSLLQRLDGVIAVTGAGVSTRTQVIDLATNAAAGGARLIGSNLLTGSLRRDSRAAFLPGAARDTRMTDVTSREAVDFSAVAQNGSGLEEAIDDFAESVGAADPPA